MVSTCGPKHGPRPCFSSSTYARKMDPTRISSSIYARMKKAPLFNDMYSPTPSKQAHHGKLPPRGDGRDLLFREMLNACLTRKLDPRRFICDLLRPAAFDSALYETRSPPRLFASLYRSDNVFASGCFRRSIRRAYASHAVQTRIRVSMYSITLPRPSTTSITRIILPHIYTIAI